MRYLLPLCIPLVWSACQPIVIGIPAASEASSGGEGGAPPAMAEGGAMAGESSSGEAGASVEDCTTDRSLKLTGKLTTPLGQPFAHAEVRLSGSTLATTSVHTDNDGNYAFEGLCAGRYRLSAPCLTSEMQVALDADRQQDLDGAAGRCDGSALQPNVLLLIYDPMLPGGDGSLERVSTRLGTGEPHDLASELADFVLGATGGHVQPSFTTIDQQLTFPPRSDGSDYSAQQYASCLDDATQCLPDSVVDIATVEAERALCAAVWRDSLDEIWLLGGPHGGLQPLLGLECAFDGFDGTVVKHVDVVGLDFSQGSDGLLARYQERSHLALLNAFERQENASDDPYAVFTHIAAQTSQLDVSGCGTPGFAPNTNESGRFDERRKVSSFCDAFYDYPLADDAIASSVPTSCEAWGCTERGYRRYWFSHLPRARWLDEKGRLNDFWRLVGRPDERDGVLEKGADGKPEPICSSSWEPGWCSNLDDEKHLKCNDNEWATKNQPNGFAEWFYSPKRLVTSVSLYARRCDEQVLVGHVEFSDGSPDLKFGKLDIGSATQEPVPTVLTFQPKLLSGLRVVIDQSTGGNPGFAEIGIASTAP
jgi:hypothetical protein